MPQVIPHAAGRRGAIRALAIRVFEAERYEDVVALEFEVVFGDRSGRSKLVEAVEPVHHLGLVGWFGVCLLSTLLASFALGRFAVVALSRYPPFARAFSSPTHVALPVIRFWPVRRDD